MPGRLRPFDSTSPLAVRAHRIASDSGWPRRATPLLFVLGAAIPLLLLTYFSIDLSTQAVTDRSEHGAAAIADESATFIQQQILAVVERADSYGERRLAPPMADGQPGHVDLAAINTQLGQLNSSRTGIDASFVVDALGHLVASQPANPMPLGESLTGEEWYRGIVSTGHSYVTPVSTLAGVFNPRYIGVATLLRQSGQANGDVIGYMVSAYNLDAIQVSVDDFRHQQGTDLTIIDGHGNVLGRPGLQAGGQINLAGDGRVHGALNGQRSVVLVNLEGRDVFAAYAPASSLGWVIVAEVPAAAALSDVARLRQTVLTIATVMGLALLGILVVGLWLMRRAQESTRLKAEFLSTMSHELKTPLSAIIGFSDLILNEADGELTSELEGDVTQINRSGRLLLRLVDDMLDLAKLEAGTVQVRVEEVSMVDLVRDVTIELRAAVEAAGLDLRIELDGENPVAACDPLRARQVLSNLIGNAIKFTTEGSITVRCRRRRDQVEVAVIDTGIGITPDARKRIFKNFIQADGSRTRKFGGSGLGLSISRQLIELQGGQMGVESKVGKGSRFWFTVPVAIEAVSVPG